MSTPTEERAAAPLVPIETNRPLHIRRVGLDAPWRWLAAGWQDMWAAPAISLGTGLAVAAALAGLAVGLSRTGWLSLILPLGFGFILIGPLIAAGLYDVSRRLELGERPTLRAAMAAGASARGQVGFFGFVLLLMFFAWINIALLLFMLFFGNHTPPPPHLFVQELLFTWHGLGLLVFGTLVGAALATGVYVISAISVPLLLVEDIDAVSAALASVHAVRSNFPAMALWAVLIAGLSALGIATLGLGWIVAFPLIGHATWHAFRDVVKTD